MNGVAAWTLGASKVSTLLDGHDHKLWLVATGRAGPEILLDLRPSRWSSGCEWEDGLRGRLRREFGIATEAVHYATFERETGLAITRRQMVVVHPRLPLHATLDGVVLRAGREEPIDLKCTSASSKLPDLLRDYAPQLTAQAMCLGDETDEADAAWLSVLWRTPMWRAARMALDEGLRSLIAERVAVLGWHVMRDRAPRDSPPLPPLPTPAWEPVAAGPALIPQPRRV